MTMGVDTTSVFPPEITEIILSKLPVKSLLRFKTVCKSWNTLISDPTFMKNHLYQSKTSNSQNLYILHNASRTCEFKDYYLVKYEDRNLRRVQLLETPCGLDFVLCYCDGVLLLTDYWHRKFGLWNPSTRKFTMFSVPYEFSGWMRSYGLCHDPNIAGDFMVIVLCHRYYRVFSCKNNAWTCEQEFADTERRAVHSEVFVDGVFYWVNFSRNCGNRITYFDHKDCKFKALQKPKCIEDGQFISLVELKGRLCVYCNIGRDETLVQIWMSEKGSENIISWKELMTIENVPTPVYYSFKPECFVQDKILLIRINEPIVRKSIEKINKSMVFLAYGPNGKILEDVQNDLFKQVKDIYRLAVVPYIDSLFFPNSDNPA